MFVVFDLETTGFSGSYDDIIEFSYIKFDTNLSVIDAGTLFFYYEGMSWSEDAYAVHGIPQEFLKQFEGDFRKNVIRMWTILSGSNVCGHNAKQFDCPFSKTWLARQGLDGLQFGIINDTMTAFRPMTHTSKVKLTKLSEMNGLTPDVIRNAAKIWFGDNGVESRAHNASYDTAATALLTLTALRKGYMSFESTANISYSDLDVNDLMDTTPPTMVEFMLKEDDGSVRPYTFGGHRAGNSIVFPGEFTYVRSGTYACGPYTLITDNPNKLLITIGVSDVVSGKDFDILDYTTKLVKGGK